jgi:hypothetical protein
MNAACHSSLRSESHVSQYNQLVAEILRCAQNDRREGSFHSEESKGFS